MKLAWRVEHVLMRCQTMPWTIFRIGDGRIPARCSDNCDMSWQLATPCTARSWKLVSAHFANGAGWAGLCRAACCVTFCFRVGFFSFRFQIFQADTQRALHSSGAEAVAWRKMAGWWLTVFWCENLTSWIHPGSASLSKKARCLLLALDQKKMESLVQSYGLASFCFYEHGLTLPY